MRLRCPACDQSYEDDLKERVIPLRGWQHNVCPTCHLAYLKVRVKSGERLSIEDLHRIGKIRTKVKDSLK